jgi:predicted RNA-binding Zn ribbon-like protein
MFQSSAKETTAGLHSAVMATPLHIAAQRLLGGHEALDFVNTSRGEGCDVLFECLRNYEDLVAWARHAGLLSDSGANRLLREARAALRIEVHLQGRARASQRLECDLRSTRQGTAAAALRTRCAPTRYRRSVGHARLGRDDDGFAWTWNEGDDLARMLWPVVHRAADLLTTGDLDRVRICPGCGWLFLDASKNRSRRWCTMEHGCGIHEKMRRYVAGARRDERPRDRLHIGGAVSRVAARSLRWEPRGRPRRALCRPQGIHRRPSTRVFSHALANAPRGSSRSTMPMKSGTRS